MKESPAEYLGITHVKEVKKELDRCAASLAAEDFSKCEVKGMQSFLSSQTKALVVILDLLCFIVTEKKQRNGNPSSFKEFIFIFALRFPYVFIALVALYLLGVKINAF